MASSWRLMRRYLSADQLGKSLDADLGKLTKVLTEQKTGLTGQIFGQASTSDIEDRSSAIPGPRG